MDNDNLQRRYEYALPRPMQVNDRITIKCNATDRAKLLKFGLTAGCTYPDYNNIVSDLVISRDRATKTDKYTQESVLNGRIKNITSEELTGDARYGNIPDTKFDIEFLTRENHDIHDPNRNNELVQIILNSNLFNPMSLQTFHDRNVIKFLTIDGDFQKIEQIDYEFGDPPSPED